MNTGENRDNLDEDIPRVKLDDELDLEHMTQRKEWIRKALILAMGDVLAIMLSYFVALMLRFDFKYSEIGDTYLLGYASIILPLAVSYVAILYMFRLYHSIWRFASVVEAQRLFLAWMVGLVDSLIFQYVWFIRMPTGVIIMGWMMSFVSTFILRFGYRFARTLYSLLGQRSGNDYKERVMIVGAGSAGRALVHEFLTSAHLNAKVMCVIDDNANKHGRFLSGVPIVGNRDKIPEMVDYYGINRIIYAIPSTSSTDRKQILGICNKTGVKVQVMPGIYQIVNGRVNVSMLRDVEIEDLLGREQVIIDHEGIHSELHGKVVMVTGGGGSIGSELCRQIAAERPSALIIFDIYENNAYAIQQELKRHLSDVNVIALIGSVRNIARLEDVLDEYKPEIIFHAAAHKHVPLMEDSPNEAIKNNVFGTYNVAKAASEHGVKKFVLISTDKAVNPTNIMGASKRLCEMIVQMMGRHSKTKFMAVRFGNVLGSNGSVIPLFKKQIAEGGPVTVTDPNIIRYFLTIPEAVSLVLETVLYANGGEIFVLDMGDPVRIDDMARNLIRLSGFEPDEDIKIVYTGLRPGEKLYEEILMEEEGMNTTPNHLIYIGKPIEMEDETFETQLKELKEACESECADVKDRVASIVTTYHPWKG